MPLKFALDKGANNEELAHAWEACMELYGKQDSEDAHLQQERILEVLYTVFWPTLQTRDFKGKEELRMMMQTYEPNRRQEYINRPQAIESIIGASRANVSKTIASGGATGVSLKATLMSAPGAELLQQLKATAPEQAEETSVARESSEKEPFEVTIAGEDFVFSPDKNQLRKTLDEIRRMTDFVRPKEPSEHIDNRVTDISDALIEIFGSENEEFNQALIELHKAAEEVPPKRASTLKRRPAVKKPLAEAPAPSKEKSAEETLADLSKIELTPKSFKRIQQAFEKFPKNFEICYLYAIAAEKLGKYDLAFAGLNAAIAVVPDDKAERVMKDQERIKKLQKKGSKGAKHAPAPKTGKAPRSSEAGPKRPRKNADQVLKELLALRDAEEDEDLDTALHYFAVIHELNPLSLKELRKETGWGEDYCKGFMHWLHSEPSDVETLLGEIGLERPLSEITDAMMVKMEQELRTLKKRGLDLNFKAYLNHVFAESKTRRSAPAKTPSVSPAPATKSTPTASAPSSTATVSPKLKQTIEIAKEVPPKLREIVDRLTQDNPDLRKKFNYVWQKAQESKEGYKDAALDTAVSMIRTLANAAKSNNEDVLEHMEKSVELALKYCQKVDIGQKAKPKVPPPSNGPTLRGGVSGAAKATEPDSAEPEATEPEPAEPAPRAPRLRFTEEDEMETVSSGPINVADMMESILPREVKFHPEGSPPDPASVAIVELISKKIGNDSAKMEALKKYLEDPEDFLNDQIRSLRDDTSISTAKLGRMPANLEKDIKLLISKRTDMSRQGRSDEIIEISKQIEEAEKLREAAAVAYKLRTQGSPFKSTGHVLAAINTHFNESGESLSVILNRTNEQIEKARAGSFTTLNRLANSVTLGLINPTLTTTLKKLAKEDEVLKAVGEEKMLRLSAVYNDKNGVRSWVRSLNNADKIVPLLIGYLDLAVRNGNISHLNIVSLKSARILTGHLRSAMYTDFVDTAKKVKGEDIDRMNAYFAQMEDFNKKQLDITRKYITSPTAWRAAGVGGVTALSGLGLGLATAGFAAPVLATGAGIASATALLGRSRVESPTAKKVLEQIALRGTLASGLALGSMGLLTAASGGTLAMIAAPGLIAPELWKYKGKIGRAAWFILPKPWRWLGGRW